VVDTYVAVRDFMYSCMVILVVYIFAQKTRKEPCRSAITELQRDLCGCWRLNIRVIFAGVDVGSVEIATNPWTKADAFHQS